MRKLFVIFLLLALCVVVLTGEKRIVGARINNQVMLLRVDLANYEMDCSIDGTNWNSISGTGEAIIADNSLSLAKLVQIPAGVILGNVSGSTANVATLSASDLKTLIGNATTSVSGLMSGADKTKLDSGVAASGANSDITSLSGLTTALSIAQGGTGLSSLGTAGQVWTVNSSATAADWATPSGGGGGASSVPDLTDVSLTSPATGDSLVYEAGTGTTTSLSHFDNFLSDEVGEQAWEVPSGYTNPTYADGVTGFGKCLVLGDNKAIQHNTIQHLHPYAHFTVDFWVCPDLSSISGAGWLLSIKNEIKVFIRGSGSIGLNVGAASLGEAIVSNQDVWVHIRLVRNNNNYYMYANGLQFITGSETIPTGSAYRLWFGKEADDSGNYYYGKLDEFRILNESLVGEFTPPTAPYVVPTGVWKNKPVVLSDTVAPSETEVTSSYTAGRDTYTIHRIKTTASTACALTVQDIPIGKELTIRVDNTAAGSVTFDSNTIVTTAQASVVFLTFINVTGVIEQKK